VTASLPPEVQDVFAKFITTEFTTVDARQQPITWPVTPYYETGGPTIDITTGIGYPKKADDAARHPRVAMLFSEPEGSGVESGIEVLVQGTAHINDADLDANRERYKREVVVKLPATAKMNPPAFIQKRLNWYYSRIYVEVRPERVFVWPDGDPTSPPEILDSHLEEVRSGHVEEPLEPHVPAAGGATAWDSRFTELGSRYEEAVLSWVGPDGFPIASRLPISLDERERRILLHAEPAGLPMVAGRACLTAHSHAPDFTWQQNFQVRGDLVEDGGDWSLVPHKVVGGFELPKGITRMRDFIKNHRRFHRTAKARISARNS
jgi:hypothetical protein